MKRIAMKFKHPTLTKTIIMSSKYRNSEVYIFIYIYK